MLYKFILIIFFLVFACCNVNSQNNAIYSLSNFTSNGKANNLAIGKATLIKQGKLKYQINCDCGKIDVKFKKVIKLKIKDLNAVSMPCSDYLLSIFEDIKVNLTKTKKIKQTNNSFIFSDNSNQLMTFDFTPTN
jgi:hypothetical protein